MPSPLDSLLAQAPMEAEMEGPPPQFLIPPPGFSAPAEAEGGKSFDVVARVKLVGDELQVEAINGQSLGEEMEVEMEVEEETMSEEPAAPSLSEAMRGSGY